MLIRRRRWLLSGLPAALAGASSWAAPLRPPRAPGGEPQPLHYPRHNKMPDPQQAYMVELLQLALGRGSKPYRLQALPMTMAQGRTMVEMAHGGNELDLMWTMTNREREAMGLIPVRIPVDRGLLGWRLMLIRQADVPFWRKLRSLAELAPLVAGQGHDWPDAEVLRANGLNVGTSSSYDGLFRMLARGRIDYFPRSIMEVDAELAMHADEGLVIAPHVMLYYPTASYYFLAPQHAEAAEQLRQGLEECLADGSWDKLFQRHYSALLARHQIAQRLVLRLSNPLLPEATPLQRKAYWLQPD